MLYTRIKATYSLFVFSRLGSLWQLDTFKINIALTLTYWGESVQFFWDIVERAKKARKM